MSLRNRELLNLVVVGTLTGLREYFNAGQRMWRDIVEKKMYVTGGVGSTEPQRMSDRATGP